MNKLAEPVKNMVCAWKAQSLLKKAADILGLFVIAAGIGISIFMNCVGRSLWVDEAMLSYSFSERSFFGLTKSVFEWDQSAPVLYLYLVKILTVIFGNTEFVLRSFSIIAYVLTLFLTYFVSKKVFGIRYPLLCAAFLANMNFMLKYSNVFKQYLSECVWVLLVLLVYYYYKEEKITFRPVILLYMVFIWGANPACFFIGGVLLYEFVRGLVKKDVQMIRNSLIIGAGVGVSFITYYFYWLRPTAVSDSMQNYWEGANFPLIPTSIADLKMIQAMIYEIFITFREARIFMVALVAAAFLAGMLWEKNRYYIVTALGFLISLFASYIEMFPIADRMWCFSFPIFAILAFAAIDRMITAGKSGELVAIMLMIALILTNNGILVYRHAENVYWKGEEANPPIAYVQEHVKEDESVYVYYQSIPVVKYKIGYDTDCIGPHEKDNILWAGGTLDKEENRGDIERVLATEKGYVIASHAPAERINPLLDALRENGILEIVQNENETPLYYYAKDAKNSKAAVTMQVTDIEEEDGICYVTIRVQNTGESYINTEFDDVALASREREDIGTNLWGNLAPGAYFDMPLSFAWENDTSVSIQLYNRGQYWYDELGFAPVTVTRGMTAEE